MDLRKILGVKWKKLWFSYVILSSKYFFDKFFLDVDELDLDVVQIMCNSFILCKFHFSIIQVVENFHLWLWLMKYFHNQWFVIYIFFNHCIYYLFLDFFSNPSLLSIPFISLLNVLHDFGEIIQINSKNNNWCFYFFNKLIFW